MQTDKTPTEVRQGETGLGVRKVLIFSTLGAAIALVIILLVYV